MMMNASTRPGLLVFYDGLNKMRLEGEVCSAADDFSESWFLYRECLVFYILFLYYVQH